MKLLSTFLLLLLLIGSTRSQDPVETVRIESDLVDLKVSVLGFASDADAALLEQKDFEVLEDGTKQEIAFFAACRCAVRSATSSRRLRICVRQAEVNS
jgi:hypothetical protein